MKRMIGLLMMVGMVVGVVGCGDDDNPVKSNDDNSVASNEDLVVGTWLDEDGDSMTFKSDGTFVDWDEDEGTWVLVEDELTYTYDDPEFAEFGGTFTLNSVTDTELTLTAEDGESSVSTRQTSTPSEDKYSETIVGTWKWYGEPHWTFSSDGTVEFDGDVFEITYFWEISGSTLTITNSDGNLWGEYPIEIKSMSDTQLVYINKIDKVDGSGTVEEEVTHTR